MAAICCRLQKHRRDRHRADDVLALWADTQNRLSHADCIEVEIGSRRLVLEGKAKRILLLVPKSIVRQ